MFEYLGKLNPAQKEAATIIDGSVIVIAGAGSGKTRVLTNRIAYLIDNGIAPYTILAVTFTNKATKEMRDRIYHMTNEFGLSTHIFTFHALGKWILHQDIYLLGYKKNFDIINEEDVEKLIKDLLVDHKVDTKKFPATLFVDLISREKNLEEIHLKNEMMEVFEIISSAYNTYTKKNNLVDFDDLLFLTYRLFLEHPQVLERYQEIFSYILVDEFQDTNVIQFEIINMLAEKHKNIFIVGDQDQSIYAFRGANYKNLDSFMKKFPEYRLIKLEENYRSSQNILDVANNLIKHNSDRVPKNLYSSRLDAPKVFYKRFVNFREEVDFVTLQIKKHNKEGIPLNEIAVIYRNNALSRIFEEAFMKYQIPYVIYGGFSFYKRQEIKDLIAFLKVIVNDESNFFLKRIINIPKRGIGDKTLKKMEEYADSMHKTMFEILPLFDFSFKQKEEINNFYQKISFLKTKVEEYDPPDFIDLVLEETGYLKYLEEIQEKNEDNNRIENVKEFKSILFEIADIYKGNTNKETFQLLLNDIVLRTDADFNETQDMPCVRLTNYHQVKGLEFELVFMPCLEQGIFPSHKSLLSRFETEEERRVCYVGITRSKELLYLTNAQERLLYGNYNRFAPSMFVSELDVSLLENLNAKKSFAPKRPFKDRMPFQMSADNNYRPGDMVYHQVFDIGIVIKVEGEIVEIAFKAPFGLKKIVKDHPSIKKYLEESKS